MADNFTKEETIKALRCCYSDEGLCSICPYEDTTGKLLDTSYSIKAIIKEHPEIANYKVKFENDFFGELVLRVIKE